MRLRDIHVPASWAEACARIVAAGGPVLILGQVDSGKSVLARYLLGRFVAERGAAALLDGDVGMAMSGPPGVVGLTLVRDVDTIDQRPGADRSWFVGSTTPAGNLLPIVLGHVRLLALAHAERLPVVVNTSGLVGDGMGKELQLAVADVVEPRSVLGLEAEHELEHLLAPLAHRGIEVTRLPPSPRARAKPRAERTSLRTERFARYFDGAKSQALALRDYAIEGTLLGSGRPLGEAERDEIERGLDTHLVEAEEAGDAVALVLASPAHEERAAMVERAIGGRRIHVLQAMDTSGLLLGLLAGDGECLALGMVEAWPGDGAIEVWSPIDAMTLDRVRRLRLGALRLARSGEELGLRPRERTLALE